MRLKQLINLLLMQYKFVFMTAKFLVTAFAGFAMVGCTVSEIECSSPAYIIDKRQQSVERVEYISDANDVNPISLFMADGKLTLPRAIEIAIFNNPAITAAGYDAEAYMDQRDIAAGAVLPEINLRGGYAMFRDDRLINPRRPGDYNVLKFSDELISGDIVLTMPLYTGGRLVNEIKAAELIAKSKKQQLYHSRAELIFNVQSVFYSILGQREVIESLIFSEKTLREHCNITERLVKAQKSANVDLLRTEVRLADIQQKLIYERNILNISTSVLVNLLGVDETSVPVSIDGELELCERPVALEQGFALAISNRQDYQSLKSQIEAQQKNLEIAKAKRLPEVSLQASYGNRWDVDSTGNNEVGEIGIYAELPLFDGGRIDAGIRQNRNRLYAQKETLRKLELQIRLEIKTATSNIESDFARIEVNRKAVEQAKESLRIEREKYELGKGAIVDVLDAQSSLLNCQMNHNKSIADYNTSIAQFYFVIGDEL